MLKFIEVLRPSKREKIDEHKRENEKAALHVYLLQNSVVSKRFFLSLARWVDAKSEKLKS